MPARMLSDQIDALLDYTKNEWVAESAAPAQPSSPASDHGSGHQDAGAWRSRATHVAQRATHAVQRIASRS